MEEKNKNIIYSIIAILLGIIVGGCTQVKAETGTNIQAFNNLQIYLNGNLNYVHTAPASQIPFTIDNANYQGTSNGQEWQKMINTINNYNVLKVRMCVEGGTSPYMWLAEIKDTAYGPPMDVEWIRTTTNCSNDIMTGSYKTGIEYELQIKIGNDRGIKIYKDQDSGLYQIQIYLEMVIQTQPTEYGAISKIRYWLSNNMSSPEDAYLDPNQTTQDQLNEIINGGKFKNPSKDKVLSEYEDKEEELWEIIGVPNYNNINIDIDSNTNIAIWDLIIRIWNQNTAILTMVITILSISILKLILNR